MGITKSLAIFLFTILSTTSSANIANIETCSIKAESACSGPLFPDDKSYTYSLGSQLDAEVVLKNQLRIYKELRERLRKEPYFPIFVDIKGTTPYAKLVSEKNKGLLKHVDPDALFLTVQLLPITLRNSILNEIPISRFEIPNEAYTEKTLARLKPVFPKDFQEDALSEEQKTFLIKYGALAILASQGFAKRVRLKESAG